MTANSTIILNYLKEHNGELLTADDVAAATGLDKKVVNGCFTMGFQKQGKGLGIRVPGEITLDDGTHKNVKFLQLTDKGLTFDPATEEDAE